MLLILRKTSRETDTPRPLDTSVAVRAGMLPSVLERAPVSWLWSVWVSGPFPIPDIQSLPVGQTQFELRRHGTRVALVPNVWELRIWGRESVEQVSTTLRTIRWPSAPCLLVALAPGVETSVRFMAVASFGIIVSQNLRAYFLLRRVLRALSSASRAGSVGGTGGRAQG